MERTLRQLTTQFPLPEGWDPVEMHQECFELGGSSVDLIGLISKRAAQTLTGSAAGFGETTVIRSYFELIERIAVVNAEATPHEKRELRRCCRTGTGQYVVWNETCIENRPDEWVASRSNGVAAGRTWEEACLNAKQELIERDRVLSAWYGLSDPIRLPSTDLPLPSSWLEHFDAELYEFPDPSGSSKFRVVGAFYFPKTNAYARGYGFGAAQELDEAVRHAAQECAQAIGFLTGEDIPPLPLPFHPSPDYHQDLYMHPTKIDHLRQWLHEGHSKLSQTQQTHKNRKDIETLFIDITPSHLGTTMAVAKALNPSLTPLVFGAYDPIIPRNFPWELRVHPVA